MQADHHSSEGEEDLLEFLNSRIIHHKRFPDQVSGVPRKP